METSRELFRCFNRHFTPSNCSYTGSSHNDSIRHLANLFGLFGGADSKSHTHGH